MPIALRFPITLMLSIVCLAAPACVDFQEGMDANERGDYATVLHELRQLAEQGDATVQSNLGLFYSFGQGGLQDFVQAISGTVTRQRTDTKMQPRLVMRSPNR